MRPLAFPLSIGLVLLAAGCATPPAAVAPQQAPPLTYAAPYATTAPTIDGSLDDAIWRQAPWTGNFQDIEGPSKPKPRYRTRAKMAWDDRYLYIAAEMEEPDVWATYDRRDMIVFHENDFEAFIEPPNPSPEGGGNFDDSEYYEFETNCLGTIFDLYLPRKYLDGGPAVQTWDAAGLLTGIQIAGTPNDASDDDGGWTLEWAIPWASLVPPDRADDGQALPASRGELARAGAAPKPGEVWKVNFSRVEWKHNHESLDGFGRRVRTPRPANPPPYAKLPDTPEDNWVWSPQWAINMHLPSRWGEVTFVH